MSEKKRAYGNGMRYVTAENLYICLENMDFDWTKQQAEDFDYLFSEGNSISDIARYFKRPEIETLLLYIDRVDKKKVIPRLRLYKH